MRHLFLPFHIWEEKQMTQNASAFSPAFFPSHFKFLQSEELLRPCPLWFTANVQTGIYIFLHEAMQSVCKYEQGH